MSEKFEFTTTDSNGNQSIRSYTAEEIADACTPKKLCNYIEMLRSTGRLEQFMKEMGIESMKPSVGVVNVGRDCVMNAGGKILVVGSPVMSKDEMYMTASKMGFEKSRFEFMLDYERCKNYNFNHLQWNYGYACVMFGPMPHCGNVDDMLGSVISTMETGDGYPPVIRICTENGVLKITKNSFRKALQQVRDIYAN